MGKDHNLSEKPFSLLHADEFFVHKILSRNSSFGRSARLSTYRLPGQIPFNWEAQPGKPKDDALGNQVPIPIICLLPPAPAPATADLSKNHSVSNPPPVRARFWKKSKKNQRNVIKQSAALGSSRRQKDIDGNSTGTEDGEFSRKSDDDCAVSSCVSYSLSSSSSSSPSRRDRRRRSKFGSLAKGFIRWAF